MTLDERLIRTNRVLRTADEWQSWDVPGPLWKLVREVTDRKARLFEAACVRRLWHTPEVATAHTAVEVWERHADGRAESSEAAAAAAALRGLRQAAVSWVMGGMWGQFFADYEDHYPGAWMTALRTCEAMDVLAGRLARAAAGLEDGRPDWEHRSGERAAQCDLLRCIFPNPFRPVSFDPQWRTSTALSLAQGIYQDREFDRMVIRADALQDAGADGDILDHLRGPGPHVRGCWAVDAVLGKA